MSEKILTLETRLPSKKLPEFLGSAALCVDSLLDDLDVICTAAQISFALDKIC